MLAGLGNCVEVIGLWTILLREADGTKSEDDAVSVMKIVTVLNAEHNFVPSFRFGRFDSTKELPRLIKVQLLTENAVRLALKDFSKLKGHISLIGISCSRNITSFELSFWNVIRSGKKI
ncbi:hypothetical protein Trydic_g9732 [Trypoxylus dichotomus]